MTNNQSKNSKQQVKSPLELAKEEPAHPKEPNKASGLKKAGIAILLLVPTFIIWFVLILILAAIDYKGKPDLAVGLTLWGVWLLISGIYFKSDRFRNVGIGLLVLAIWILLAYAA